MSDSSATPLDQQGQLQEAFIAFNDLSGRLTDSYRELEDQVRELNTELASARAARSRELAEKERLAIRLTALLDSLPGGVIVLDHQHSVILANPVASNLLNETLLEENFLDVIRRQAAAIAPDGKQLTLKSGKRITLSNQVRDSYGDQVVLITDVTEAHAAQEASNRKQRLSALGEMVARLAHQIRTPLSSALLYMGQLSRRELSVTQRLRMTGKVTDRLKHMESLVNSSLSFVQGGEVDTEDCSLFELLESLKLSVLPMLQQRSGIWSQQLPKKDVLLQANREALLSALVSIAENAVQMVAEPELTIGAVLWIKTLDITIADNGPGVDGNIIEHIFDPFYTTRQGGTGLGLALAAMIAQSHDAAISVRNGDSGGAVFTLHLPISRIRLAQPRSQHGNEQARDTHSTAGRLKL